MFGLSRFGLSTFSLSRFGLSRFGIPRFGIPRFGHGFVKKNLLNISTEQEDQGRKD
jgi:hypothetical protein